MLDLRITACSILDGTGSPPFVADVGIIGDTISAVGNLSGAEARRTIAFDASPNQESGPPEPTTRVGQGPPNTHILCPGFIDAHSHSDTYLLLEPSAPSKISQGITTEVCGNCGSSGAPISNTSQLPSDWADKSYPGRWSSLEEYRRLLETMRPAVNVVMMTGHNTLRRMIVGYDNRPATREELAAMKRKLAEAMDHGSSGLSTGLVYPPGCYAAREEIVELAAVAAKGNGIYASHMRSESAGLVTAVKETLQIGRESGCRVQVSHLKAGGKNNWGLIDQAIGLIRAARDEGQNVCADRYPYTSGCTELDVLLPGWAVEGGRAAEMDRLRDPDVRRRVSTEIKESHPANAWESVVIASTTDRRLGGLTLAEAAEALETDPVDALLKIIEKDALATTAFFFGMSEDNMIKVLAEPYVMIGSDASLRASSGPLGGDYPHPRAYGSFPKFLRMALDGKSVTLPEAVRKMTSLPAEQFGLRDRGVIREGHKADIVVFDPAVVADMATYAKPRRVARGVSCVIVNGKPTIENRGPVGPRAGRFLKTS